MRTILCFRMYVCHSRAPISLLKVKHDQPVELRIAERRNEPWTRQPPPPQGPFAGSGHRLGAGSPFPEEGAASSASATTTSKMPGTLPSATATASASGGNSAGGGIVEFEVDRNEPTTQVQIRLRNGERQVVLNVCTDSERYRAMLNPVFM